MTAERAGIYVVDVPDPADASGYGTRGTTPGKAAATRLVIIAASATEAETIAALAVLDTPQRDSEAFIATFEVGRLGTYDPGMSGARMTALGAIVARGQA